MGSVARPRILIVGPTPPPYHGGSVVTHNLVHSKLKECFELILLDTADRRSLGNIGNLDLRNVELALWHGLRFSWLMLSNRPDLVYIPISQGTWAYLRDCLFLIPARLSHCKVVVHLHGSDFGRFYRQSQPLMRGLIRWTLQRASRAIVLGYSLRSAFSRIVGEERITVVPNGVAALTLGVPDAPSRRSSDRRQVIYLGSLMKTKGFLEVLHSIPFVVSQEPSVHFLLAGEQCYPEEMQEARIFINSNNLERFVSMPGVVVGDAKARLLDEADIFVFPAIAPEGQPLVILEAMSAGLPVIATPQGAIPDTVRDRVNGFLVPPGDPAAIADKILLLLRDENLRRRMGQASRERFLKYYTLDHWASNMTRMFQQVLQDMQ